MVDAGVAATRDENQEESLQEAAVAHDQWKELAQSFLDALVPDLVDYDGESDDSANGGLRNLGTALSLNRAGGGERPERNARPRRSQLPVLVVR